MNIVAWTTPDGSVFCDDHKPLTGYDEDELHPVFDIDEGSDDTVASCERCVWERVQEAQMERYLEQARQYITDQVGTQNAYNLVQYWTDIFVGAGLDDRASTLSRLWNDGSKTEAVALARYYESNNTIKDME